MSTLKQYKLLVVLQWKLLIHSALVPDMRKTDARTFWRRLGFSLLMLFAAVSLLFSYGFILYAIIKPFSEAGMGNIVLGIVFLLSMLITLLLGLFSMLTALWGSRDTELLAAMPLRPRAVFLSKLTALYFGHLGMTLFMTVPAILLFALYTPIPTNFQFWAFGIVVILLLPVIPMLIAALLSLLLMRLSALTRRREMWTVVGSVLLIAAILVVQSLFQRMMGPDGMSPEAVQKLLSDGEHLLRSITGVFPPATWAVESLTLSGSSGVLSFAQYAFCILVGVLLLSFIADWLYYKVSLSQLETARSGRQAYRASGVRRRGVGAALFWRELKILARTPAFLLNGLIGVIIFPILILLMPMLGGSQAEEMEALLDLISGLPPVALTLALAGLTLLPALINPAVSTMVSREGRTFWMLRLLPVSMETQVRVKAGLGLALALFGEVAMALVLLFGLGLPATPVLLGLLLAVAMTVPATLAGLYPDLLHPKLNWISENEAMKMNMNSLTGMVLSLLVLIIAAAVCVPLALAELSLPWITAAVLFLAAMGAWGLYRLSMKAAVQLTMMDV